MRITMTLLSILLFRFVLWPACVVAHEAFVRCLHNNSKPTQPISAAIYTPRNSSYPSVLQSHIRNLRFNESTTPKPLVILTPLHASHIQAAIFCAKSHGLQMRIRSGGHDYEGASYVSEIPFFLLDMFKLRAIHVSIEEEIAWVQAGATLGEVYYHIANKSSIHGFPAGVCPTVGVGGHFSGGGYGNMMRKFGLTIDNILDAQLIDVEGRILDRESMGEDMFWAITGGGASSFGVVVAYKIKLVQVPETVTVFKVPRTLEQNAVNIFHQWQLVANNLDKDLFIRVIIDVVQGSQIGDKTIRASFQCLFLGDSMRLLMLMNKSFPELGLQSAECSEMSWIESVLQWASFPIGTPINALLDRTPRALSYLKRKSDYLQKPIPKEGLKFIFSKMIELERTDLKIHPLGGRMSEISPSAKPFANRAGNIALIQYATNWKEAGAAAAKYYTNLTRDLHFHLTPFVSRNPRQAFLNYRDFDLGVNNIVPNNCLQATTFGIQYFKDNFDRLVRIKSKVDPNNFFKNEQSIPTSIDFGKSEDEDFVDWSQHGKKIQGFLNSSGQLCQHCEFQMCPIDSG